MGFEFIPDMVHYRPMEALLALELFSGRKERNGFSFHLDAITRPLRVKHPKNSKDLIR